MTRDEFDALCVKVGVTQAYGKIVGRPDWGNALQQHIPPHMHDCMVGWLAYGESYDEFLTAVVTNDLKGVFLYGDDVNRDRIMRYMLFLHNYAPSECYGSKEAATLWAKSGGIVGQLQEETEDGA